MIRPLWTILLLLISIETLAQQSQFSFSLGPAVIAKTNIRPDNQYDPADKPTVIRFIPFARLKLGPLSLSGQGVEAGQRFSFFRPYIAVTRTGSRYYGPGMEPRKDSWFVGLGANIAFLKVLVAKDIQKRSRGTIYDVNLGYRLFLSKSTMLRPAIGATYTDDNFTNYFYGVLPSEVTATRPEYNPGGAWNYSARLMLNQQFGKRISMILSYNYTIFGTKIRHSPTTKTDRQNSMLLGLTFKVF